jgi:hypothetical protein
MVLASSSNWTSTPSNFPCWGFFIGRLSWRSLSFIAVLRPLTGGRLHGSLFPRRGGMLNDCGLPPIRSRRARQIRFAANSSCRRETGNQIYVVILSASRVRSRSALSAALVPLGGVAVVLGLACGVSMWLARSSLMLTFSRSRHSAHLSQASESACQPDCPSRSDESRDASLQACARIRQSDTLIIAVTPPNARSTSLRITARHSIVRSLRTRLCHGAAKMIADYHSIPGF